MAYNLPLIFLYELLATFLYVAIGCGGLTGLDSLTNSTYFGLYFGMTGLVLVHIFGYCSGTLLNPSIAVATFVSGIIPLEQALTYMVAQFAGAFGGYQFLNFILGAAYVADAGLCMPTSEKLDEKQILAMEFVLTLLLVFGLLSMMQRRNYVDFFPFRYGAILATSVIVGVLTTGIGLNSAVMVAVGASTNNYDKFEYYIGGQSLGAILGPSIWKFLSSHGRHGR